MYRFERTVLEQSVLLRRLNRHEEVFWLLCLVYQERCTLFAMEFYNDGELFNVPCSKR